MIEPKDVQISRQTGKRKARRDHYADMILDAMRPVVHTVANSFGRNCEVVLHDFRNPAASVIEIGGKLTDREVGAPANEINQWLLAHGRDVRVKKERFIRTTRGRTLRTSTTLFRGEDGKAFGAFCVNIDVTELLAVARSIADLAGWDELAAAPPKMIDDIAYVVNAVVAAEEAEAGGRLNISLREDRLRIFKALQAQGVFSLQRAVPRLANHFGLSRATIYRYLDETGGAAEGA